MPEYFRDRGGHHGKKLSGYPIGTALRAERGGQRPRGGGECRIR